MLQSIRVHAALILAVTGLLVMCEPWHPHQPKMADRERDFIYQIDSLGVALVRESFVIDAEVEQIDQPCVSLFNKRSKVNRRPECRGSIGQQDSTIREGLFRQDKSIPVPLLSFKFFREFIKLLLRHSGIDDDVIIQNAELPPMISNLNRCRAGAFTLADMDIKPRTFGANDGIGAHLGDVSLALYGNQYENIHKEIASSGESQNPIRDARPLPPLWGGLLAGGCIGGCIYIFIWAGRLYVYDLRPWLGIGGGIFGVLLGMCGFCVLLWDRIL